MASQSQTGTDRSASALGLGYKQWTRTDLTLILSHYGVSFGVGDTNNILIDSLNQLAAQRGLTREDRLAIIKAHKAGLRLPPRKALIRAPIAAPRLPQTADTLPATAHGEEYSSGASDGSDVEMSDDELAEELPSLSEEERDLCEYTATMNFSRGSGQRRTLRPRSAATLIANRPTPQNRPLATTPLAVRDRSVASNRRVTTNRPALLNGSATIRRIVPSNARRSRLAAANRADRPTASLRPRDLTHTRSTLSVSSNHVASRPSTPRPSQAVNTECIVCFSSFEPAKTLMRQPTSSCVHEVNICRPCLSTSISSQIEATLWTRIGCPAPACGEYLGYGDIQEFAEPQVFARYFAFTFQAAQAGSHFQRCRTPGCEFGQQCFPEDTIMNCQECHYKTCITCDTEMHPGVSCRDKAAEREAAQQSRELDTTKYLEKRAKKCPGCSAPTQKTGGCDHITCKSCGHEYCWLCLADYGPINEEGNEHHAPDCEYHSDNL